MSSKSTFDVFNGVSGFSGFFKPSTDGLDTAITFVRGNASKASSEADSWIKSISKTVLGEASNESIQKNINDGFLAQSYSIQWGRGVTMQRVLNKNKPIAMVGVGSGQLGVTGMLGTFEGFKSLLGLDDKVQSTEDLCNPLNAIIACGNGFIACDKNNKQIAAKESVCIILTNVIVAGFNLGGQYDQNNILMQTGTVNFQIGGCKIQAISN